VKSCVVYLTKKQNFAWLSSCRWCVDRDQNLPEPVSDNVLRVLQISSKSVHFFCGVIAERVNTAKTRRKVNSIFGWSLALSRIIIGLHKIVLSVKRTATIRITPLCRLACTDRAVYSNCVKLHWDSLIVVAVVRNRTSRGWEDRGPSNTNALAAGLDHFHVALKPLHTFCLFRFATF